MTTFSVWAPGAATVEIDLPTRSPARRGMERAEGGWWRLEVPDAGHGDDYAYVVDGSDPTPDPRSRWQPEGVHGPSRWYDHSAYAWRSTGWRGVALPGAVLYEMHVGTFTAGGTFDAAVERLDHLVDLGVDAVEVMPVAAFPGRHGWGYDGVHLWAVHEPYGGPDAFKRFVDECHLRGLGVVLDVVYNHLGPSGNYLPRFGPYFTDKHHTPWGSAVNLDDEGSDEVRRWIVENALSWFRDYHVDGLRLDAVHALVDERAVHVLEELSSDVDALAAALDRPLFLVAESDLNDAAMVTPREAGGLGVHAQWLDDYHHALHTLLTGERQGYYDDFGSIALLAQCLERVFRHDGAYSTFRGRVHGRPVDTTRTQAWRFVTYLQDHDQIGNRAVGDRIGATLGTDLLKVGAALVLTAPFTPMLFMGEEWAASTPWQYFTDHQEPELAEAVRQGRRREFASHGWAEEDVPDPQDPATVERSRLDWSEAGTGEHAEVLQWHRALIRLRRATPDLTDPRLTRTSVAFDEEARWLVVRRGATQVAVNLGEDEQDVPLGLVPGPVLLASAPVARESAHAVRLAPRSVAVLGAAPPRWVPA
ncbi:malto-oligosyltrehalose trehalohydrolase [Vallicoccus soli]|uniref:Malto-oligosyltrehalose trehalohydrolase n=1 Tax=Vallicoccus soli TaxID=2339232 RepID=A0A3A3ZCR2_9ACTN|nr:malto-oligosyltrehalose trehalohydrolase [Vallicoccus soli]RJK92932.1 malto-oligosyltrehalose trehalohydrolase [Vallicoccus soli]